MSEGLLEDEWTYHCLSTTASAPFTALSGDMGWVMEQFASGSAGEHACGPADGVEEEKEGITQSWRARCGWCKLHCNKPEVGHGLDTM